MRLVTTNGQTSALLQRDGTVYCVLTVSASADGIDQVLWMVNPEKITAVSVSQTVALSGPGEGV